MAGVNAAGGLIGGNSGAVHASYATGNVTVSDDTSCVGTSCPRGAGGLIGFAGDIGRVTSGSRVSNVQASYSTGMVSKMSGSSTYSLGGLAGIGERDASVPANNAVFTNSYWDNETSGQTLGVGSDDEDANGTIDGTETATAGVTGQTTTALKAPTGYTGIFADWNVTIPGVAARTGGPWDFGAATDYPVLRGLGAPPAFPAGTALLSVAEEGAANTQIGSPLTATATVGDALSYKLVGAGAVFFSIHPATGQLSTTTRLDYENPSDADRDNTYELMVQASDGMTVAFRTVAVSVTNVDDAGAVDLMPDPPVVGKSLTATLSDPDGGVTQSDLDLGMVTHPHRHVHDDQQREQRDLHARSGGCGTVPEGVRDLHRLPRLREDRRDDLGLRGGGQPAAEVLPQLGDARGRRERDHGNGGHGGGDRPRQRRHHLFRGRRRPYRRDGVQRGLQPRLHQRDDHGQVRRHHRLREQVHVRGRDHGH